MKFIGRWAIRLFLVMVVLLVALVLLKDALLQAAAQYLLRSRTGLDAKMSRFELALGSPTITIEGFKLYNKAEFGGSPLLDVPELHVEYDVSALAARRVHLKLLRLNLSEVNIVESKDGRTNLIELIERLQKLPKGAASSPPVEAIVGNEFSGIDTLNLTVGRVKYTNLRSPAKSGEFEVGLKNEILTNVKSFDDISNLLLNVLLRRGVSLSTGAQGIHLNLLPQLVLPPVTNAPKVLLERPPSKPGTSTGRK